MKVESSDAAKTHVLSVDEFLTELWSPVSAFKRALISWLEQRGYKGTIEATDFEGKMHSETILLTLHALTLDGVLV